MKWKRLVSDITGKPPGDVSRATPVIANVPDDDDDMLNLLIDGSSDPFGSVLYALDQNTGSTVWTTILDQHPAALIT